MVDSADCPLLSGDRVQNLLTYIYARISLSPPEESYVRRLFVPVDVPPKAFLLTIGALEQSLFFLDKGIVRGYQNQDGKIIVEHLVEEGSFFASTDSFVRSQPSLHCFETITHSRLFKITKPNFEQLRRSVSHWNTLAEAITHEHLKCKTERALDLQTLTAKERYLKFVTQSPNLALRVSVNTIASYLGIEPTSLSRIRRPVTI